MEKKKIFYAKSPYTTAMGASVLRKEESYFARIDKLASEMGLTKMYVGNAIPPFDTRHVTYSYEGVDLPYYAGKLSDKYHLIEL